MKEMKCPSCGGTPYDYKWYYVRGWNGREVGVCISCSGSMLVRENGIGAKSKTHPNEYLWKPRPGVLENLAKNDYFYHREKFIKSGEGYADMMRCVTMTSPDLDDILWKKEPEKKAARTLRRISSISSFRLAFISVICSFAGINDLINGAGIQHYIIGSIDTVLGVALAATVIKKGMRNA